ncbi:MAG: hypothetical protein MJ066_02160 [Clostridia bacterium]|nr:hypothetical protein [Clostridia bacterium]
MIIKDIIKRVLNLTDLSEERDFVNSISDTPESLDITQPNTFSVLLSIRNNVIDILKMTSFVISEIASSYIPMVKEDVISVPNTEVSFAHLSEKIVKIIDVQKGGESIKYKAEVDRIKASRKIDKIIYQFMPGDYKINQKVNGFTSTLFDSDIAMGVLAEYYLKIGKFDEASLFRNRFLYVLERAKKLNSTRIGDRAWL